MPNPVWDDVQVTFGAKIDGLVKGIADVKTHLTDLEGKFAGVKSHTESISHSIDGLSSGLKAFAATVLAAFSIEGMAHFAENMANLGSKMENIRYSIGISAQSVVELSGIAKVTGTSIDGLTFGIERMALNIRRATSDSTNPFAQALKNLGLSTKDFIGLRGDEYFQKLAGAVAKFNPDMNLTTNLMQLGGRSFRELIPALMQGEEAFKKYRAAIIQASDGLAAAQPGMVNTHSKLALLSISVEGLRARIFSALKPAIDSVVESFTAWAQSIDSATIVSAAQAVGSAMIAIMESLSGFVLATIELLEQLTTAIKEFNANVNIFSSEFRDKAIRQQQEFREKTQNEFRALLNSLGLLTPEGKARMEEFYDAQDKAAAEGNEKLEKRRADYQKVIDGFRQTIEGITSTLGAPGKEAANKPPAGGGMKAPALQFPGSGGDALGDAQRQIAIINQQYQMEMEKINHAFRMSVDVFGAAEAQKTAALLAALSTREASELAELEKVQSLYAKGSKEYERVEDEKTKIIQRAALDRLRIENQAAEASWQKWKSAANDISGAFNSHLREMFQGTMTFSQAVGRTLGDMIIKWTGSLVQLAVEWVAKQLWMAATGKAIEAGNVAAHGAAEATKTAATTAGVAARTGAEATGAAGNVFSWIGDALKFIFTQAAKVFAGIFGFLSPVLGPAAIGPAIAGQASVMAVAATIPALDVGTDYVSRAGMAMIHKGEQVVPAKTSGSYTGANSGGSNTVNVTVAISAVDAQGFNAWLKRGGAAQIAKAVSPVMNRNLSTRPSY